MSEGTFPSTNADTILCFQIRQVTDAGADIVLQVVDLPVDIIALHNNRVQVHDHGLRVQHLLQLDLERTQRLRSRLAEIANRVHLFTQRKPPNHWRVEVKSVGLPHFLRIVVLARRKETSFWMTLAAPIAPVRQRGVCAIEMGVGHTDNRGDRS